MANIIFSSLNPVDLGIVKAFDSVNQISEADETFILTDNDANLEEAVRDNHTIYIPSTKLRKETNNNQVYVYFDLELYPFFQKVREVIDKPKGVLRFRRTLKKDENKCLMAGDLYVLTSLLGEPENIQVKHTNRSVTPYHQIVTVNFGEGAMVHMEYTFSNNVNERIELEWSGIKKIIEFDSEEMSPIDPSGYTSLPLAYTVDSILASAHKLTGQLRDQLENYNQVLNGGVQS